MASAYDVRNVFGFLDRLCICQLIYTMKLGFFGTPSPFPPVQTSYVLDPLAGKPARPRALAMDIVSFSIYHIHYVFW